MKRKDYELIAKVIKGFTDLALRACLCKRFTKALLKNNANFNVDGFITACGL